MSLRRDVKSVVDNHRMLCSVVYKDLYEYLLLLSTGLVVMFSFGLCWSSFSNLPVHYLICLNHCVLDFMCVVPLLATIIAITLSSVHQFIS